MFDMFLLDNNDLEFKFLYSFARIKSCEKWTKVRLAFAKTKDGVYKSDASVSAVAQGRPHNNKRAKAARDSTTTVERLQSLIEQCITDATSHSTKREEKSEARWLVLMMKQDIKVNLLMTNIAAKKRNINLAFLMGADMATMDPQVKAWYLAERNLILNLMTGPAAATTTTTPTQSTASATTMPTASCPTPTGEELAI
ncbi:putative methionyl-tRNA synthetase [Hordeum vulgare]|nr:putative methionyl-tRNA synthetase [Hordeum vulgare]